MIASLAFDEGERGGGGVKTKRKGGASFCFRIALEFVCARAYESEIDRCFFVCFCFSFFFILRLLKMFIFMHRVLCCPMNDCWALCMNLGPRSSRMRSGFTHICVQRFIKNTVVTTSSLVTTHTCEKLAASHSVILHHPPPSCKPLHQTEVRTCGS